MSCLHTIGPRLAVLSYGRTGSIILAKNLLREFNQPDSLQIRNINNKNISFDNSRPIDIVHSHLLPDVTTTYCKIFSIRPNVVDCITSMYLAKHYQNYHKVIDCHKPFELTDLKQVDYFCREFINWHRNAEKLLDSNSYVVTYDQLISKIIQSSGSTNLVYKEKNKLITNWDQVTNVIAKHKNKMEACLIKFQRHKNPFNIYKYINHNFEFYD